MVWLTGSTQSLVSVHDSAVVQLGVHRGRSVRQRMMVAHGRQEANKRKEGLGPNIPFKVSLHLPHFLPLGSKTSSIARGWGHTAFGELSESYC